ncbi:hypothetical protein [Acinetobacter bereziniae]|uniref:hypothetical protein n=1 Tax=Acinetobacter bereziniae TaxID=106648 RepID=UPI00125075EB|nr:hypothetical protein [Acinetobacter bereziniae]MDA3439638.1 hypothetical protein [Acinetobacter bereziniae]
MINSSIHDLFHIFSPGSSTETSIISDENSNTYCINEFINDELDIYIYKYYSNAVRKKSKFQKKIRITNDNVYFLPEAFSKSSSFLCSERHINKLYSLEQLDKGHQASIYSTVLMHYAIRCESTHDISIFFEYLNISLLTSWSLIALLRSTNAYKNDIKFWRDLYLLTYSKVESEGLNPKQELYGLDRGIQVL